MSPHTRRTRPLLRLLSAVLACLPFTYANASNADDLAAQHWIEVDSPHFRIVTEQPESIARLMAADLENLRHISNRVRGAEALGGPPLTILALGKSSFRMLELPETWGGVFQLNREGYAAIAQVENYVKSPDRDDLSRSTLLHEYHHFLLHYAPETTAYPMWYDEGMSEYWSSLVIEDGKAWFGHPVEGSYREYWLVDRMGRVSFDTKTLFAMTRLKYDSTRINNEDLGRFYARSRYAIHYFNSTPELRQQLAHYLRLFNAGFSQEQAVRLAFKRSYDQLDRDMRLYAERNLLVRGFSTGKDGLDLPQPTVTARPLDRGEALAVLADVVPRFMDGTTAVAKELVATNLKLHPDDPQANVLALTYRIVDDGATRIPALLRTHPNDARLLTARAQALSLAAYGLQGTGGAGWEAQLQEARMLYRRAIQADPAYPLAYAGLGSLNLALPAGEPAQEGIACLDTAVIYEPRPDTFRSLARLYLRDRQLRPALKSMRSAVAFARGADRPLDALLMENLELVADMTNGATPDGKGLRYKSGAIYEGALQAGKPHGQGKWTRPNGTYYEGEFADGLPSGRGKLASERGVSYEGDFGAGMAHGQGHIAFPAGSSSVTYDGGVEQAAPGGRGVLVTKDGRLDAGFEGGEPHGDGVFTPARNATPVRGAWRHGGYAWPEKDGVLFTGDIDADGRRAGRGWCRMAASGQVELCRYKDGQKAGALAPD